MLTLGSRSLWRTPLPVNNQSAKAVANLARLNPTKDAANSNMDETIRKQIHGLVAAGRIASADLVLLLAKALEVRFTGTLYVQSQSLGRSTFLFQNGAPEAVRAPRQGRLVAGDLGDILPPEQIAFVENHAAAHHVDELTALGHLHLLPELTLKRLREHCLLRALSELVEAPVALDYRFTKEREKGDDFVRAPLEPLTCFATVLAKTRDLTSYRQTVSSVRQAILKPIGTSIPTELPGPARQVLLALRREPVTFDTLRLRRVAPEDTLIASIWALLASGGLRAEPKTSALPPSPSVLPHSQRTPTTRVPPASTVRTRAATEATAPLYSMPVRASQVPTRAPGPSAESPPSSRGGEEMGVESASFDAWTRAVADPRCSDRALRVAERAAARFPKNPRILFYLGVLQVKCGLGEEGEQTLRRVLKLDPEHTEAQKELHSVQKQNGARSQTRPTALLERLGARKSS